MLLNLVSQEILSDLLANGKASVGTDLSLTPLVRISSKENNASWNLTEIMPFNEDFVFGLCDIPDGACYGFVSQYDLYVSNILSNHGLFIDTHFLEKNQHPLHSFPRNFDLRDSNTHESLECDLASQWILNKH